MITQKISLNTCEINHVIVYANEGEVQCRYIEVLFKDDEANDVSLSGYDVTFYAKKPDGTSIYNSCTVDTVNNTATVELTSQTLSASGVLECEFQIYNGSGTLLKVGGLKIAVAPEKGFSGAIESTDEFNVLTSAINEARGFSNSIGDLDDLTTTEKSTIVGAINEIQGATGDIGNLANLTTTEKSTVVGAINEVNGKVVPISKGGTGAENKTQARTNLEVKKEYVLYNNLSGSNSTITLSDSISNYSSIEVYYHTESNGECSNYNKFVPGANPILLFSARINDAGSECFIKTVKTTFSSSTVSFAYGYQLIVGGYNDNLFTSNSAIKIYKVVGYKY